MLDQIWERFNWSGSDKRAVAMMVLVVSLVYFSTSRLDAGPIPACPSTVFAGATFPPASGYVCSETDNFWLDFQDIGAGTIGDTALPTGTTFHIDQLVPGEIAITLEPSSTLQFLAGDTYSWGFEIIEDSSTNEAISAASAGYVANFTQPNLTSTVNALNISSFNPPAVTSAGGLLGTLSNNGSGAYQQLSFSPVLGVGFTDTLTGIGADTVVQAITNDIGEVPEPAPGYLAGAGLLIIAGLRALSRRRAAAE
jgi:hypothetical protein